VSYLLHKIIRALPHGSDTARKATGYLEFATSVKVAHPSVLLPPRFCNLTRPYFSENVHFELLEGLGVRLNFGGTPQDE